MKHFLAVAAFCLAATPALAQSNAASGSFYLPSCEAALEIAGGKHPAADSPEVPVLLRKAAVCFSALTAIMNVEQFFKPEFAMCAPAGKPVSMSDMVVVTTAYLKAHPDKLANNFHQLAVAALAEKWPCPK